MKGRIVSTVLVLALNSPKSYCRKRTAAERDFDKSHAKMLKDGHMAFKKDAGEQMKGSTF